MTKYRIRETNKVLTWDENTGHYKTECGFYYNFTKLTLGKLGLHLDPIEDTPKKLYAWRSGIHILFTKEENSRVSGVRAEEYDIVYPKEGEV